ncbi:MAG: hypothetical protein NTV88_02750 [Candidatus Micrarchaeota archaeon]|nr:hypothetical protein [Candidatus Micrarchaeota archaeon]
MAASVQVLKYTDARKIRSASTEALEKYSNKCFAALRLCASKVSENENFFRKHESGSAKSNLEESRISLVKVYGKTVYSIKVLSERYEQLGTGEGLEQSANCMLKISIINSFINEHSTEKTNTYKYINKAKEIFEKLKTLPKSSSNPS